MGCDANMENGFPEITDEFIVENKNHYQKINSQRRKGGPYSKHQRDKRREKVYRLHFEYGYSASKISDLMKVNRNTINGDIDYWYSRIIENGNMFDPSYAIMFNLQRLDVQRTRLREQLDKTKTFQEKIALERLILEIDSKILYTHSKLADSTRNLSNHSTGRLNAWLKNHKSDERCYTLLDMFSVSTKAFEKINEIIEQDRTRGTSL